MVAAVMGIVLADFCPGAGVLWSVGIAVAWVWFASRNSRAALAAVILASFALVHELGQLAWSRAPLTTELAAGRRLAVSAEGLVQDEPVEREGVLRFPLRVQQLSTGPHTWVWDGVVWVGWMPSPGVPRPRCGDRIRAVGTLARPEPPRNPGEYDFATHLRRKGAISSLRAQQCVVWEEGAGFPLRAFALRTRAWLERAITQDIEDQPEVAATIKAMVLGVREEMPEEINDAFVKSGTLHIFSVSGLHVALVAALIWRVLNLLGLRKRLAAWVSVPLVLFYAVMTGWQPAAVRSAFMASVVLAGIGLNRPTSFANTWCFAGFLVLLLDTQQLFSPGAQLSFVVIAALVAGGGIFYRRVKSWCEPDPFLPPVLWSPTQRRVTQARQWVANMICASAAALLGSLLLTLWHFQSASFIGLLANLLHVPLAGAVLGTAGSAALATVVWPWLAAVLNNANLVFSKTILVSAGWFAAVPGGHTFWNPRESGSTQGCRVTFFDAGDGGAVLVRTAQGRVWLIDTGSERFFRRVIRSGLRFYGIEKVDGVVLTHGDAQHVGGAAECLTLYQPNEVLHPPGEVRSAAFREALLQAGHRARSVRAGEEIVLDEETRLRVLLPGSQSLGSQADDGGLVLRLDCAGGALLLMGDAGYAPQQCLREQRSDWQEVNVVHTGRHVSDELRDAVFWAAVAPSLVIAAGKEGPREDSAEAAWMTQLESDGCVIFPQWETGAVEVFCGREGWSAGSFMEGRTWQQR